MIINKMLHLDEKWKALSACSGGAEMHANDHGSETMSLTCKTGPR